MESIHTYQRHQGRVESTDFQALAGQDQAFLSQVDQLDLDQLEATQKAIRQQRKAELQGRPAQSVAPVVAKDASIDPSAYYMAYDSSDSASLGFIAQMAAVGRVEDFHVVANCEAESEAKKLQRKLPESSAHNVTCVVNPGGHDTWAEDHGEYTDAGEMVIPAILPADFPIDKLVNKDRVLRFYPQAGPKLGDFSLYPKIDFSIHGSVNDRTTQQEALAGAMATGATAYKMAVSYVEGGNFMPGRLQDGTPFALVGKDSVAVTAGVLHKGGRKGHSNSDAVKQIARDYGLKPAQVIPVEQPGEFHIDMAMALAGPGQVLLNDSRAVADLQKQWINEAYEGKWIQWGKRSQLQEVERRAEHLALYENMVESDLKKAGLQVFRVPGCFPASKGNAEMNFFNLRQGKNAEGESFAVAMGGDERAEKAFAHTLLSEIPAGYQRIHFLDRELTPLTLELSGGIKCRSKARVDLPA